MKSGYWANHKKASTEEIIAAYKETGSVWQAAKRLGMVGQSVWERLRAIDYPMRSMRWTKAEIEELKQLIGQCTLSDIALRLGRPYAGIAGKASKLGITTRYGNRIKRKVPRGIGLNKHEVKKHLVDLRAWSGSLKQFCRARGMSLDLFAAAVQRDEPETWRTIAWQRGLPEKTCPGCGVIFYPMTSKQIGCTRKCINTYRSDQAYFGGKRQNTFGLKDGICQLCERQNPPGLSSHHLFGKEHDPENDFLVALCRGCHNLVTLLGVRSFLDEDHGWERLIEFVTMRRLGDKRHEFAGTHVCVERELLTQEELLDELGEEEAL